MDKSKKIKLTQVSPILETQNLEEVGKKSGNVYEALHVIAKRANQISSEIKKRRIACKVRRFRIAHR
jgi:hypothetical protein